MQNTKVRSDNWTDEEDLILAEVMLRYIRHGNKLGPAYEEVATRTRRTAAGANFRWQSTIKKRYETAIGIAKAQAQNIKNGSAAPKVELLLPLIELGTGIKKEEVVQQTVEEAGIQNALNFVKSVIDNKKEEVQQATKTPLQEVIEMLVKIDFKTSSVEQLVNNQHNIIIDQHEQIVGYQEELALANAKIAELESQVQAQKQNQVFNSEDYRQLVEIFNRAKQLNV